MCMCNAIGSSVSLLTVYYYEGVKPSALSAYLEITDIVNKRLRYIPVPAYVFHSVILQLNFQFQCKFLSLLNVVSSVCKH